MVARRRRLVEAVVRLGDDDRTDVVAAEDVVDAHELGNAPVAGALLEAGAQGPDGVRGGGFGIRIVDIDLADVSPLDAGVEAHGRIAPHHLAVGRLPWNAWKAIAGVHGPHDRWGADHRGEGLGELRVEQRIGERSLEAVFEASVPGELHAFSA